VEACKLRVLRSEVGGLVRDGSLCGVMKIMSCIDETRACRRVIDVSFYH
jgi:hypothetical protein